MIFYLSSKLFQETKKEQFFLGMVSLNLMNSQSSSSCQTTLRKNRPPPFLLLLSFLHSLTYWTFSISQLHHRTLLSLATLSKGRIKHFGFRSTLHSKNHTSMKYCVFQYLECLEATDDWAQSFHLLISVYGLWIDNCYIISLDFFSHMK